MRMLQGVPDVMTGWVVHLPGPVHSGPLVSRKLPVPTPGPDEVLLQVSVCAVCRTDLHLVEGDLAPRHPDVVPGHEVVGRVVATGDQAHRFAPDARVGVAWLRWTCGQCRYCRRGAENLC